MRTRNRSRVARPGATQERPIEIVWSGPFEIVPGAAWCGDWAGYVGVTYTGAGDGSHLGPVTASGRHCSHLETGDIKEGTGTLIAANGDHLNVTYSGHLYMLSETDARCETTLLVDGGTGRFANATGELEAAGTIQFTSQLGGFLASRDVGFITYDASDRSHR